MLPRRLVSGSRSGRWTHLAGFAAPVVVTGSISRSAYLTASGSGALLSTLVEKDGVCSSDARLTRNGAANWTLRSAAYGNLGILGKSVSPSSGLLSRRWASSSAATAEKEDDDAEYTSRLESGNVGSAKASARPNMGGSARRAADDLLSSLSGSNESPYSSSSARANARTSAPTSTTSSPSPSSEPHLNGEPLSKILETHRLPFDSLKGLVSHPILKALTFRPFQFEYMSEVQERVLGLLPELIGRKPKNTAESTPELIPKKQEQDESELEKSGSGDAAPPKIVHGREANWKAKKDLIVKARTGTGKTIAFLVPAIEARLDQLTRESRMSRKEPGTVATASEAGLIRREVSRNAVGTLIISPTRELATQIANESIKTASWIKELETRLCVGGVSKHEQMRQWKRGRLDTVVATPGRLADLISDPVHGPMVRASLAQTETLILDEADTLMDMGFAKDLQNITRELPHTRQTFLFSATMPTKVREIARDILKPDPLVIDCVPKDEANTHAHIPQYVTTLASEGDHLQHIMSLLAHDQLAQPEGKKSKAIVFCQTTAATRFFTTLIRQLSDACLPFGRGTDVIEMHSGGTQPWRERNSRRFRETRAKASILVTSDVSARGVDYADVTRVIQVGAPSNTEQYVHRIGRTGRGGATGGRGDLVLMPFEQGYVRTLRKQHKLNSVTTQQIFADLDGLASQTGSEISTAKIDAAIKDLVPQLDPSAINEVVGTLLGHYRSGCVGDMNADMNEVYEGLQDWSTKGLGLEKPVEFGASFLSRLSIGGRGSSRQRGSRNGRYGGDKGGYGFNASRSSFSDSRPRSNFGSRGGQKFDSEDRFVSGRRNEGSNRFDRDRPPRAGFSNYDRPSRFEDGDRNTRHAEDFGGSRPRSGSFRDFDNSRVQSRTRDRF